MAGLLWLALGMAGAQGASTESGAAAIVNSGSTNRAGFRIVVEPSGRAEWLAAPQQEPKEAVQRTIPSADVKRFYADLDAAQPLASLPQVHCVKSVSFGSTLRVELAGQQTPDLSCGDGGSEVLRNLIRDVRGIVAVFQAP